MALLCFCECQEWAKQTRVGSTCLCPGFPGFCQGLSLSGHSQPQHFVFFYLNPEHFAKPADQMVTESCPPLGQMSPGLLGLHLSQCPRVGSDLLAPPSESLHS